MLGSEGRLALGARLDNRSTGSLPFLGLPLVLREAFPLLATGLTACSRAEPDLGVRGEEHTAIHAGML